MLALPPPPIDYLLGQPRPQDSLSDGTPEPPKSDSLVPCAAAAGSVAPSSVVQVPRAFHKPSLEEMLKTMQEHLKVGAPQTVPKGARKKKAATKKHKKKQAAFYEERGLPYEEACSSRRHRTWLLEVPLFSSWLCQVQVGTPFGTQGLTAFAFEQF